MSDPAKPLLTREMCARDEEFFAALIRMARTGRVAPHEPAPYSRPGKIARSALGMAPERMPDRSSRDALEESVANEGDIPHVPKAKGRAANAAPAKSSTTSTVAVLQPRRMFDKSTSLPRLRARWS
jgi:hypothetical protein